MAAGKQGMLYPLTQLARFSPLECFSECFAAYHFENDALYHKDPVGYTVSEDLLHRVGLL